MIEKIKVYEEKVPQRSTKKLLLDSTVYEEAIKPNKNEKKVNLRGPT